MQKLTHLFFATKKNETGVVAVKFHRKDVGPGVKIATKECFNGSQTLYFLMEAALGGELYATYNRKGLHGFLGFKLLKHGILFFDQKL